MSEPDGGVPAFPQHLIETRDGGFEASYDVPGGAGMTLRDWFAGQALASGMHAGMTVPAIAARCYRTADAMLAERAK